jgi:hypothetical protein
MTPSAYLAHARYFHRAAIVTFVGCWLAFLIGYLVPDSSEVCDV